MPSPYVSARTGLWDASDVDTWGQGLGVYPNTAADVVTVVANHVVTYNKSATTALGAITVNGTLTFLNSMSTKLVQGAASFTVSATGKVYYGTQAAPIPAAYTCEHYITPTSDNAVGWLTNNGAIIESWGDAALYGSDEDTELYADCASGTSWKVVGDFSAKWASGQILTIHKGALFANQNTDVFRCVINAPVTYDGTKSTISVSTAHPGGTFKAGGRVLNVSRNIIIGKMSATETIGTANTNRPRFELANGLGSSRYSFNNTKFVGCYRCGVGTNYNNTWNKCVLCHQADGIYVGYGLVVDVIAYGMVASGVSNISASIVDGCLFSSPQGFNQSANCTISANVFSNTNGVQYGTDHIISGNVFSNSYGVGPTSNMVFTGNNYHNLNAGFFTCSGVVTGRVGYNSLGASKPNMQDYTYNNTGVKGIDIVLRNLVKYPETTVFVRNGSSFYNPSDCVRSEHHNNVLGAHIKYAMFGDVEKDAAVVRSGGASSSIKVSPLSNCSTISYIPVFEWEESNVPASAQTRSIKVKTFGFSVMPTASEFYWTAEYISNAVTLATTVLASTDVNVDNANWKEHALAFTPAAVGTVRYRCYAKKYAAAAGWYIDAALYRTGLATLMANWSDGEAHINADYKSGALTDATGTGSIGGVIKDSSGSVIDCSTYNVRVNAYPIANIYGPSIATALVTDPAGAWSIGTLVAGTKYLVTFEYEGAYTPLNQTDIAGAEFLTAS